MGLQVAKKGFKMHFYIYFIFHFGPFFWKPDTYDPLIYIYIYIYTIIILTILVIIIFFIIIILVVMIMESTKFIIMKNQEKSRILKTNQKCGF